AVVRRQRQQLARVGAIAAAGAAGPRFGRPGVRHFRRPWRGAGPGEGVEVACRGQVAQRGAGREDRGRLEASAESHVVLRSTKDNHGPKGSPCHNSLGVSNLRRTRRQDEKGAEPPIATEEDRGPCGRLRRRVPREGRGTYLTNRDESYPAAAGLSN